MRVNGQAIWVVAATGLALLLPACGEREEPAATHAAGETPAMAAASAPDAIAAMKVVFPEADAKGEVQIKDLIIGAEIANASGDRDDYLQKQADAQFACKESDLVEAVRKVLTRHNVPWK